MRIKREEGFCARGGLRNPGGAGSGCSSGGVRNLSPALRSELAALSGRLSPSVRLSDAAALLHQRGDRWALFSPCSWQEPETCSLAVRVPLAQDSAHCLCSHRMDTEGMDGPQRDEICQEEKLRVPMRWSSLVHWASGTWASPLERWKFGCAECRGFWETPSTQGHRCRSLGAYSVAGKEV